MTFFPSSRTRIAAAVGASLLLAANSGFALTLGRMQGQALIGRPLDMNVLVAPDNAADSAALCLESEVFYGDLRVDPARVSVRMENATAGTATVRVRSTAIVDEPVVTVYLRAGCTQKSTRRYVLLTEQPSDRPVEVVAMPVPDVLPLPGTAAPASSLNATPIAPLPRRAARAARRAASAAAPAAPGATGAMVGGTAAAPRVTAPSAATRSAAPPPANRREGARLRLDPIDLSVEREPSLKASSALASVPVESTPEQRAQALALWEAINARPEDILRRGEQLQKIEAEVKTLRDTSARNNASLAQLRGELEQAQSQRYANPVVYVLALLLALAAAAAVYFWRRRPSGGAAGGEDWWQGGKAAAPQEPDALMPIAGAAGAGASALAATRARRGPRFEESSTDAGAPVPSAHSGPSFRSSTRSDPGDYHGGMRPVKAEELNDIQQQADFFVSLGEYDQAIEVLRAHIDTNPETSVVAWLDLLEIYHKLQQRENYESTRQEFLRVFNAQVPEFDAYRDSHGGLEEYSAALSRIVALWPSRRVLEVIEESIFRKPGVGVDDDQAFGLEAYRELLLLHNIGKEVIENVDGADSVDSVDSESDFDVSDRSDFSHTQLQPLSTVARRSVPREDEQTVATDTGMGLDINLDDPGDPTADFAEIDDSVDTPKWHNSNMLDFDLPEIDLPPEPTFPGIKR